MSRDALVVGVNTYQYLPSLKAPAKDAEAIAQQLHAYGEFRVHRLPEVIQDGKPRVGHKTSVTLRELETALINLFKPKGSSIPQTALFYFSGHGIQRDAGIREGYLALSDSNPDKGFYGLSLFWLRRLLQESPVRQRIILLDCCHSGELLNFLEADPGAHPGTDRLFMAASREYETAYESLDSQYSVFTDALLIGLDPHQVASGVVTNHSLTDCVNRTLKGEIQQPLFESSGSEIILTRRRSGEQGNPSCPLRSTVQSKDVCPYRGLEFFDESHVEYFFGREDLTIQLIEKLQKQHFIAITGASGSGKSSLVRAGLIAQLRQGKQVPGSDQWKIRLITPTEHPLKSLAAAFIEPELSDLERAEQLRRAETFLQDGGVGLAQLVRASLPATTISTGFLAEQRPQFLLVIDQFEEVFTLSQGVQAERERQEFFDCLLGALEIVKDMLRVVIVLRADFLNKCSLYEGLSQQITQHQILVSPLKYEQIKATIVRPAQKVGLICEPNLVYTMMMDIIGAPGELPLLQYTLAELWRRRRTGTEGGVARLTLDAYQELGGVRGTLQKRATEVFHSLTTEEQTIARRIFLSLTQLGEGTEDTRRRVNKSELISPAFPSELVEQVLEKLVAAKLIVISQESLAIKEQQVDNKETTHISSLASTASTFSSTASSQEIVDVTHEALIRNWSLLRGWLDENRDILRRQRRIEQAAQEWYETGQPTTGEYLLHGLRLRDAEDFLKLYPQELSALAQQYISVSCANCRRTRRESRQLQVAIPSLLAITLTVVLSQYYSAIRTQTQKESQLQQATARERAAIAQAVLQDSNSDPMTALLIGRLAAENQEAGYEAQASLRASLQNLRLQLELQGHKSAVQQIAFSPDHQHMGTASADGTIRIWAINTRTIYNTNIKADKVFTWSEPTNPSSQQETIQSIAFSPDGQQIAAIAKGLPTVKIWSVQSGAIAHQLANSAAVKQISFSPTGEWLATLGEDQSISIWQSATGLLKVHLKQNNVINSLQFSADGQFVLSAGENGNAQLWQLTTAASGMQLNLVKTLAHPKGVEQAVFSAHGRWITTLSRDGKVRLWDGKNGELKHVLPNLQAANPENISAGETLQQQQTLLAEAALPPMKQLEFSPDERMLATIDAEQHIWLWDTQTGQLQTQLNNETTTNSQQNSAAQAELLKFSPNNQMMITTEVAPNTGDGFYAARLWNRQGHQVGKLFGHQKKITAVEFSPDGTYVVTAGADGTVRLWAAQSGGELPSVHLSDRAVEWVSFLPNQIIQQSPPSSSAKSSHSASLNASSENSPIGHLSSGERSSLFSLTEQMFQWQPWRNWFNFRQSQANLGYRVANVNSTSVPPTPSETVPKTVDTTNTTVTSMVTIADNGQLQQWQILTDNSQPTAAEIPSTSDQSVVAQSWHDVPSLQKKIKTLTQSQIGSKTKIQPAISGFAQSLQSPSQAALFALSTSNHFLEGLGISDTKVALSSFALSADGQLLATADLEGWLRVYRVKPERSLQLQYQVQNWRSTDDAIQATGEVVNAATALSGQANPAQPLEQIGNPVAIRYLTFSPDGQQLLGIADDLTMRSWNSHSGQLLQVFRGHEATIRQAHYSADSQLIVSASWDRTARIWQASTGQAIQVLPHDEAVSSAAFSPDQQRVVTASWNGTAAVWQIETGKKQFTLNKHQKSVLDAQFSPDGTLLVTSSADGSARLWKAATGEEQALLRPNSEGEQSEAVLRAFFSPDGQYVATLTQSGQVNLWAATWDMLTKLARERSLRQLTPEECSRHLRLSPEQCPKLPS